MNELVSVIIPVYNVGEILKESVNSLLLGEYQKIEILIVDDGSDEQTARMCEDIMLWRFQYIWTDPRYNKKI